MITYTIKSPHKMKIWEAKETTKKVIEALGIQLEMCVFLYSNRRCGGGVSWDSLMIQTPESFICIIHVYADVPTPELDLSHLVRTETENKWEAYPWVLEKN